MISQTISDHERPLQSVVSPAKLRPTPTPVIGLPYVVSQLLTSAPLLLSDFSVVFLTCVVVRVAVQANEFSDDLMYAGWMSLCFVTAQMIANMYPAVAVHPVVEMRRTFTASGVVLVVALGTAFFIDSNSLPKIVEILSTWVAVAILASMGRMAARNLAARIPAWAQPCLISGEGPEAETCFRLLENNRSLGLSPVRISDSGIVASRVGRPIPVKRPIFWSIVTDSDDEISEGLAASTPHRLYSLSSLEKVGRGKATFSTCFLHIGNKPFLYQFDRLMLPGPRLIKKAMDYLLAIVASLVLLPLIVTICIVLKASSRGPLLYRGRRIGRDGKRFWTLKFRTMRSDAAQVLQNLLDSDPELLEQWRQDHKLKTDPRITPIGNFLRKTSLDELPQLIHVFAGDMSLVGPRPIVDEEIEKYAEHFASYCRVLPGITGLWQVSGRNDTTYDQRVNLDDYYVQNWTPWLDLYILVRTLRVVLLREGAY